MMAENPKLLLNGDVLRKLRQSKNPKEKWQFREIIHAGMILSSFHTLADFCNATGLNKEISDQL